MRPRGNWISWNLRSICETPCGCWKPYQAALLEWKELWSMNNFPVLVVRILRLILKKDAKFVPSYRFSEFTQKEQCQ